MPKEKKAMLVCFSVKSEKFESHYERNKFFRRLYGWKQVITKRLSGKKPEVQKKVYTYRREGLLDEMPHKKIDQSSFIVPENDFERITNFLEDWHDKVIWKSFKVLLDEEFEDFFKEVEQE